MNKKMIFRIMGAISAAMIIVSVFVPFISIEGYSESLWDSYKSIDSIYLPIMIIVFGVIALLFFLINKKTEFAYMTTGAILFFVVMNTVDIIDQGMFNALGIGYYFLAIGAVLTGVMAFLVNLKSKVKEETKVVQGSTVTQASMLNQIDKLYSAPEPVQQASFQAINPVNNVVQPSVVLPMQTVATQVSPTVEPVATIVPIEPIPEIEPVQNVNSSLNTEVSNPVLQQFEQVQPNQNTVSNTQNDSVQQSAPQVLEQPVLVNPTQTLNDVKVEVTNPSQVSSDIQFQVLDQAPTKPNPVLEQFEGILPSSQVESFFGGTVSGSNTQPQESSTQASVASVAPSAPAQAQTDIFGQPINKS